MLSAAFVLLGSAQANAATVTVVSRSQAVTEQGPEFLAAPGEANDVTVTDAFAGPDQRLVTIHDSGAVLDVGAGCVSSDSHTVRCTTQGIVTWFELGDGNDRLQTLASYSLFDVVANGGPGNDVLDIREGSYEGVLDGGGGRDRLYGGPYGDYLTDGDRDDAQGDAGPGPDVLDGGASPTGMGSTMTYDVVSYEHRTAGVRVDLARESPAGERGERDTVRNIESAYGGAGADHLAGTDRSNYLAGGRGRDTLIGRRGADTFGSAPFPGLGLGLSVAAASAARGDTIFCGRGMDTIHGPRNGQYIRPKCEGLVVGGAFVSAYPTVHRRSLSYEVVCPLNEENPGRCSGRVTVREAARAHRLLATGTIPRTPGETSVVAHLRVTPIGHQLGARPNGVLGEMRIRGQYLPRNWWTIRMRIKPR